MAQNVRKTVFIDVETENTGIDPIADSRRIISVQIGDSAKQELFYADARVGDRSLFQVAIQVRMLMSQGHLLAGYNVKGFEVPLLKRFLAISIPDYNVLDLKEMDGIKKHQQKTGKTSLELEEVCAKWGVSTAHRRLMDERAEPLKKKPEVLAQASEAVKQLVAKGWSPDASQNYALGRIATGTAILESYEEFVEKGGAADAVFHMYAVGDVVCEHQLLLALQRPATPAPASTPA